MFILIIINLLGKQPGPFLRLNEIEVGDQVEIFSLADRYLYRVTEIQVVPLDEVSVLEPHGLPWG